MVQRNAFRDGSGSPDATHWFHVLDQIIANATFTSKGTFFPFIYFGRNYVVHCNSIWKKPKLKKKKKEEEEEERECLNIQSQVVQIILINCWVQLVMWCGRFVRRHLLHIKKVKTREPTTRQCSHKEDNRDLIASRSFPIRFYRDCYGR